MKVDVEKVIVPHIRSLFINVRRSSKNTFQALAGNENGYFVLKDLECVHVLNPLVCPFIQNIRQKQLTVLRTIKVEKEPQRRNDNQP